MSENTTLIRLFVLNKLFNPKCHIKLFSVFIYEFSLLKLRFLQKFVINLFRTIPELPYLRVGNRKGGK